MTDAATHERPDGPTPGPAEPTARVRVVIVTYNSMRFIDRCLAPLIADKSGEIEVVVVDNVSPDGTADHVEAHYPGVRLIRSPVNGGFAAGNNLGFAGCEAPYILMLNPDAFVEGPGQILAMVDALAAEPGAAALGPRLLNADGTHQIGDAGWGARLGTITAHMFFLQRFFPSVPSLYLTSGALLSRPVVDVDWVCGACTLVRTDVVRAVGGLDEKIFMYGEDVEWGMRMRKAGYRILYVPHFVVDHLQGATQKGEDQLFYSTKWIDSSLGFIRQNDSRPALLAAKLTMAAGFLMRSALYLGDGIVRRRPVSRARAGHMWNYMLHVLRLPDHAPAR